MSDRKSAVFLCIFNVLICKEKLNEAVGFIRECMEKKPFPEFDLPLVAEASAGENFGNLEELEE